MTEVVYDTFELLFFTWNVPKLIEIKTIDQKYPQYKWWIRILQSPKERISMISILGTGTFPEIWRGPYQISMIKHIIKIEWYLDINGNIS